ncbi:retrovirus-related pol polyprotein from transposon TNT 1-94 [Tanacetum coccineum]
METIHVKFDELTTMASEHNCLEPETNRFQDNDSSAEDTSILSKKDLDNLFFLMYEEYFEKRSTEVSINSAAQPTPNNEEPPFSSSTIVEDQEAPLIKPSHLPLLKIPSNMHEFHQVQPSTHIWTKAYPLEQVIDHSWIESMQDELHQFQRLDIWELVPIPEVGIDFEESFAPVARLEAVRMGDILLVQVYVDDNIFGFTNPDFSKRFANLMKNNFEMSMMGEIKFLLGLQVHQSPRGIFISHAQYAIELLKKHGMDECDSMNTPMATARLDADLQGTPTDQTKYRSMIGELMYLTASRPDIAFATFDSGFELIVYSDADHTRCHDDCKSTSGGLQFLGEKLSSGCGHNFWIMDTNLTKYQCIATQRALSLSLAIWTKYQLADLFTKALLKERFEYLFHRIGMRCMTST